MSCRVIGVAVHSREAESLEFLSATPGLDDLVGKRRCEIDPRVQTNSRMV